MPWMVEFVNGDGRAGREGLMSELKVLIKDTVSDKGEALDLANEVPEGR
jgi:hypothetical protein